MITLITDKIKFIIIYLYQKPKLYIILLNIIVYRDVNLTLYLNI